MSKIIIREAAKDDANQIADVLEEFYNMSDHQEARSTFFNELNKDFHYLVALKNDKVIGLVTWITHGLPKHGLFELDRICILSNARGMGVGKKLLNSLIKNAENWYKHRDERARKLYLLTHEENKSAHMFYEKVGFIHETTLKDHYYTDQDERVYSIFLKN